MNIYSLCTNSRNKSKPPLVLFYRPEKQEISLGPAGYACTRTQTSHGVCIPFICKYKVIPVNKSKEISKTTANASPWDVQKRASRILQKGIQCSHAILAYDISILILHPCSVKTERACCLWPDRQQAL